MENSETHMSLNGVVGEMSAKRVAIWLLRVLAKTVIETDGKVK